MPKGQRLVYGYFHYRSNAKVVGLNYLGEFIDPTHLGTSDSNYALHFPFHMVTIVLIPFG